MRPLFGRLISNSSISQNGGSFRAAELHRKRKTPILGTLDDLQNMREDIRKLNV